MKKTSKFLSSAERKFRIQEVKARSNKVGQESLILDDPRRREFMRYEHGELVEYDLTRSQGRKIALRPDEAATMRNFPEAL